MLRLRARLAVAATRTGLSRLVLRASARLPSPWQRLTIMTWHRVASGLGAGFDRGVVDASPEQFDCQVEALKRDFTIIGTAELVRYHEEGRPLPPNPALLTFDDGYRDNLTVALPVLQKHHAKAVFFVPTGFMEPRQLFPWERIGAVLAGCQLTSVRISYPETVELSLPDRESRFRAAVLLYRRTRMQARLDWPRFMRELEEACGNSLDPQRERALAEELILDWSGVRTLVEAGMEVQSHGDRHELYPSLSAEDLLRDATVSRTTLEARTGLPQVAIAYPGGVGPERGQPGYRAVQEAGYKLGFCLDSRSSRTSSILDWLNISRLSSEPGMTQERFRGFLAFPDLLG